VVDTRQVVSREALTQITNDNTVILGDRAILSIDNELTAPLRIKASEPASLVVNVGSIKVTNPQTGRVRTIPPISGTIPSFSGGTITLPAVSGGNITNSTGAPAVVLTLGVGLFVAVGVNMSSSGQLIVVEGIPAVSAATCSPPITATGCRGVGHFIVQNLAGVIQPVSNASIYQYSSAPNSGSEGAVFTKFGDVVTSASYSVGATDYLIPVDTTANAVSVNLPVVTDAFKGRNLIIKDVGGKASQLGKNITVVPAGADQIDGINAPVPMDLERMSLTFICNGVNGWVMV